MGRKNPVRRRLSLLAVVAARYCRAGEWGKLTESVQRSNYRAVKDHDKCTNCGECVRRCQFFAHTKKPKDDKRFITGKSASDVVRV